MSWTRPIPSPLTRSFLLSEIDRSVWDRCERRRFPTSGAPYMQPGDVYQHIPWPSNVEACLSLYRFPTADPSDLSVEPYRPLAVDDFFESSGRDTWRAYVAHPTEEAGEDQERLPQTGDIVGPWMFEDLQDAMSTMWLVRGIPPGYILQFRSRSIVASSSGRHSSAAAAEAAAAANLVVGDWSDWAPAQSGYSEPDGHFYVAAEIYTTEWPPGTITPEYSCEYNIQQCQARVILDEEFDADYRIPVESVEVWMGVGAYNLADFDPSPETFGGDQWALWASLVPTGDPSDILPSLSAPSSYPWPDVPEEETTVENRSGYAIFTPLYPCWYACMQFEFGHPDA